LKGWCACDQFPTEVADPCFGSLSVSFCAFVSDWFHVARDACTNVRSRCDTWTCSRGHFFGGRSPTRQQAERLHTRAQVIAHVFAQGVEQAHLHAQCFQLNYGF
jgi:hypothetical protein